jgi:hypothetical protein
VLRNKKAKNRLQQHNNTSPGEENSPAIPPIEIRLEIRCSRKQDQRSPDEDCCPSEGIKLVTLPAHFAALFPTSILLYALFHFAFSFLVVWASAVRGLDSA